MKGLIQRVKTASVSVDGDTVGAIEQGLLLLLGVEAEDTEEQAEKLLDKVTRYRVFSDDSGRMNLSLNDIGGELLVVSQFTLVADTKKGLRPSFSSAASPAHGELIYQHFVDQARALLKDSLATGQFGTDMQVSLVNDGPVTFMLTV